MALSRFLYRCLLRAHPPSFRAEFSGEMLWIFDEVAQRQGVSHLFADVLLSLARQWFVRCALQKLFAADSAAAPWIRSAYGLFAWERIEAPATSLPVPRMLQGSIVSVAFLALLSLLAIDAGKAATIHKRSAAKNSLVPLEASAAALGNANLPMDGSSRSRGQIKQARGSGDETTRSAGYTRTDRTGVSDFTNGQENSPGRSATTSAAIEVVPARIPAAAEVVTEAEDDSEPAGKDENLPLALVTTKTAASSATPAQLLTAQYDNARTGANLNETILTPANVNAAQFGKLFTIKVDGDVYAQPLYLPGVDIPGKGKHNVLFVATENDSVYAFDADNPSAPLWHVNLANSAGGVTPLSERDTSCFFIVPQVGITSTPVIDPKTGTLYVLARTKEHKGLLSADVFRQRLHALAITTGAEKFGGPVEIKASVKGTGSGQAGGQVAFDPQRENPRAALLLVNGSVYLSWGSSCDVGPYHGWLMAYDANTLAQKAVFNTSPDATDSAIWQGDAGPAADKDGNVFVVTGNGEFDAATNGRDFGDTVLKLSSRGQNFTLLDYFTPSNQAQLNDRDNDLGSSGPVLLPDQAGAHPHVLVAAGKEGKIYVIDRDRMGKFQPNDDSHAVQTIAASHGAFGAMAYWNQNVFFIGSETRVEDFAVDHAQLKLKASGPTRFLDSGATPVISANGSKDAIVWAASSKNWNEPPGRPAILYAYDAADVTRELFTTEQNSQRDRPGVALRFAMPAVINGKVFLGCKGQVDVYGLIQQR
ncbi:MAG: pyrrolo-quinoline quinone [Candidatus Acidiferrum sp.]